MTSFVVVVVGLRGGGKERGGGGGVGMYIFCFVLVWVFLDGKSVMSMFCNVMMLLLKVCACMCNRLED